MDYWVERRSRPPTRVPRRRLPRGTREGAVAEGGETVEPILDAFGAYGTCAMFTVYNVRLAQAFSSLRPFGPRSTGDAPAQALVLLILIGFREEVQMTVSHNIKNNDMLYFLLFSVVLIPFQFIADVVLRCRGAFPARMRLVCSAQVFTLSVLELFHGWKIYDYLIYTRYRFLQRETRWEGLEDSLDECIDESVRTLDQMCFSSQYYMMMTVAAAASISLPFRTRRDRDRRSSRDAGPKRPKFGPEAFSDGHESYQ